MGSNEGSSKQWRRPVIAGVVLVALVLVVGALVASLEGSLERAVERGIEREGTEITGTSVTVEGVELSLLSGEGSVRGLWVENPPDFQSPEALQVAEARLRLEPWSVLVGEGPVVVNSVEVSGAEVTVEAVIRGRGLISVRQSSNIGIIGQRVKARFSGDDGEEPAEEAVDDDAEPSKGRRVRIERLTLEETKVNLVFSTRRRTFERRATFPSIELRDLGGAEGVSPKAIGREVVEAVIAETKQALGGGRGKWTKLGGQLMQIVQDELGEEGMERLRDRGGRFLELRKAGKSLREIRQILREERSGQADGGVEVDGGAEADGGGVAPRLAPGERLRALRERFRQRRLDGDAGPR